MNSALHELNFARGYVGKFNVKRSPGYHDEEKLKFLAKKPKLGMNALEELCQRECFSFYEIKSF